MLLVGFSGGLDSTVLLHLISNTPALHGKIRAVHINHGLSQYADAWQRHCEDICQAWNVSLSVHQVQVEPVNIEEDARLKRYAVFASELPSQGCLLLGHHQDDVAETLFLNLMRGSGLKGVGGIPERVIFARGTLFRPLLSCPRSEIQAYATQHALHWVEDESNDNRHFSRNYIRHEVLPTLQQRWPKANEKIAECARHLQEAQYNLYALAEIDCPLLREPTLSLPYEALLHLNEARLMNVIMTWLHRLGVQMPNAITCRRIINEIIYAAPDKTPVVAWGEYKVRRYESCLYLSCGPDEQKSPKLWRNFPEPLRLNSREVLVAYPASSGFYAPPGAVVEVRYRLGGETLKRHQSTHLLKKLFQEHRVLPWLRGNIPLVYVNDELVCAVDFLMRDPYDDATPPHIYQIERRYQDETI